MAKKLEIIQLGNPILRETAAPVAVVEDKSLQNLIKALIQITVQHQGVGIAAPQVSQSLRLMVIASHPTPRYPQAPLLEPTAMINPRLTAQGEAKEKSWEGCLSIPGIRGLVPRYTEIFIEYTNVNNQICHQKLTGFIARIFQHEYDHLNGIVFLDRVENTKEMITELEYRKLFS